ncbi:MAG: Sec-independent protein translocase protein TatB [Pyrinomonadaceae bacterium]
MFLLIFESLGMSEMLVILVVALIIFGPRKLPQLSRSLGKSLAEFKRASEDFKRTWDQEVSMEDADKNARIERAMLPPEENSIMNPTVARERAHASFVEDVQGAADEKTADQNATSPRADDSKLLPQASGEGLAQASAASIASTESPAYAEEPTSKRDWL